MSNPQNEATNNQQPIDQLTSYPSVSEQANKQSEQLAENSQSID